MPIPSGTCRIRNKARRGDRAAVPSFLSLDRHGILTWRLYGNTRIRIWKSHRAHRLRALACQRPPCAPFAISTIPSVRRYRPAASRPCWPGRTSSQKHPPAPVRPWPSAFPSLSASTPRARRCRPSSWPPPASWPCRSPTRCGISPCATRECAWSASTAASPSASRSTL